MIANDLPGAVENVKTSLKSFYGFVRVAMESMYTRNAELYIELQEAKNKIISLEALLDEKGK